MIATVLPMKCFSGHSINVAEEPTKARDVCLLTAVANSVSFDYYLRQQVSANLTQYFIHQCPVPRPAEHDALANAIVRRAARLVCVAPEFNEFAREAGLTGHEESVTDEAKRARLRAEIDGLVAHLYGLTEEEFAHILGTFPLVADPVKVAARNAYRDIAKGLLQ